MIKCIKPLQLPAVIRNGPRWSPQAGETPREETPTKMVPSYSIKLSTVIVTPPKTAERKTRLQRDPLEIELLEARHQVNDVEAVVLLAHDLIVQQRQHHQLFARTEALQISQGRQLKIQA